VLKPKGIAFFEACPLWTSARGHHIHESTLQGVCLAETNYRDDGTVIPDWSHLVLSEHEMRSLLAGKLLDDTLEHIVWLIYHSDILNKCGWNDIKRALLESFTDVKISVRDAGVTTQGYKPCDNLDDYDVYGFIATVRHRKQNALDRRLIWRLPRIGL
jgi:hypothetical protein